MNTNKHKEKNCDSVIELLRKEYLSKNAENLNNRIGEIVQDHINRGLHNSTVCISKQLRAHYDHVDNLIDYIVESLKKDFPNIPLGQCKEKLLAIVDNEYKKLIPFANQFLVNTGLASQSILKSFETGIEAKKGNTKQAIETKIAIIEEQRLAAAETLEKKPWYKKALLYISGFVLLLAAILAIAWYALDLKERFFSRE
ncbi:MAG: hypothetical protein JW804_07735 [Sedimentisphaerales bacterium]|nr:hypothetical protein [Sedimentisphaerales bacterium]